MKNKIILILVCASMFLILSCATVEPVTKAEAYSDLYAEKPEIGRASCRERV